MNQLIGALDADVTIALAKGGVFQYLRHAFGKLYVAPGCRREVVDEGPGLPGEAELRGALGVWIDEVAPDSAILATISGPLSVADRETIALAIEMQATHVLSGDLQLRREAANHSIPSLRASDVVVLMARLGLIPKVKPVLDQMIADGFGIEPVFYQQALNAVGE